MVGDGHFFDRAVVGLWHNRRHLFLLCIGIHFFDQLGVGDMERKDKACSLADFALDPDFSAMEIDVVLGDIKPKSGTTTFLGFGV